MRSSSVTSAAPCCFSSRATSRCVVITALLRRPRDLVITSAVAPPFASPFVIRAPKTDSEFNSISALRAEAYYADQPGGGGRFVESYKKQFREQEARSLRERVAPRRRRKEGGLFQRGEAGGSGGGGVFGGVLGVLVGRATSSAAAADSSSSASAAALSAEEETEKGSSSRAEELFLPPECECLAAIEVATEEEEEEEGGGAAKRGGRGERGDGDDDDTKENARPSFSSPSPSPSPSVVLGALDLRPPSSAGGGHPAGVPASDEAGCAVLNLAVHPSSRRRGVARALLRAAAAVAGSRWGASALYTTVAATNAGARALYADFGFVEVTAAAAAGEGEGSSGAGSSPPPPQQTPVGRELLLRVEL